MLIREVGVDFILLAGYLKLIPMELIRAYPRSIVNIHPSLLPAFGGKGYYGMKVHKAVIASGARYFAAFAVTLFPLFVFLNYVLWLSSSSYLFTILNTEKVSHLFFFSFLFVFGQILWSNYSFCWRTLWHGTNSCPKSCPCALEWHSRGSGCKSSSGGSVIYHLLLKRCLFGNHWMINLYLQWNWVFAIIINALNSKFDI